MMRSLVAILSLAAVAFGGVHAQVSLGATIPEGSALLLSHDEVVFDLSQTAFPPPSFPWVFEPTAPEGPVEIQLYSNLEGGWALSVEFDGLLSEEGALLLPSQVRYRLDGAGAWLPLGQLVTLLSGYGVSHDYQRHLLEFRLELMGNERPGAYAGTLVFSLSKP
jgi:hypothetical protein